MVEPFTAGVLLALGVEGVRWLGVTFAGGVVQVGAANTLGRVAKRIEARATVDKVDQSGDAGVRVPDRVLRAWLGDDKVKQILDASAGGPDPTDPATATALVDRMIILWHDRPEGPTAAERRAADRGVARLLASLSAELFPNQVLRWLRTLDEKGDDQGRLLEHVLEGVEALDLSTLATKLDLEDFIHELMVNMGKHESLLMFMGERNASHRGEEAARMALLKRDVEIVLQEQRALRAELSSERVHGSPAVHPGSSVGGAVPSVPERVRQEIEEHFGRELAAYPLSTWSVKELIDRGEAFLARDSPVLGDLLISAALALDATQLIGARAGPSEIDDRFVEVWQDERPDRSDQPLDLYDLFHLAARLRPLADGRDNSAVARCVVRLLRALRQPVDDDVYRWADRWGVVQRDLAAAIKLVAAPPYRLVVGLTHHRGWGTRSASVSEHLCVEQSATSAVGWVVQEDRIVGDPIEVTIDGPGNASQAIARICGRVRTRFLPETVHVMLPVRELIELNPAEIEIPIGPIAATLATDHLVILHSWDRLSDPDVGIRRQVGLGGPNRPSAPKWIRPDDDHLQRSAEEREYYSRLFTEVSQLGATVGLESLPTRSTTWSVILAAAPYLIWHRGDQLTPTQKRAVDKDWAEFPGCAGSSRQRHRAFDVGELGVVWDSPEFVNMVNELGLAGVGPSARFVDTEWGDDELWT